MKRAGLVSSLFMSLQSRRTYAPSYSSFRDIGRAAGGLARRAGVGLGLRTLRAMRTANQYASSPYAKQLANAAVNAGMKRLFSSGPKTINAPGPKFNPGGSGGYVTKVSRKRKRKRVVNLGPGIKAAVAKLIGQKSRHWNAIQYLKYNRCFRLATNATYDYDPATAGLVEDYVGWTSIGGETATEMRAYIDAAYRKDAYTVSGTAEVRKVPQSGVLGGGEQQEYKIRISYDIILRNNGGQQSKISVYKVRASEAVTASALGELNFRYEDAYVQDTGVIGGTDPQVITKSFRQGFNTPRMSKSNSAVWKQVGETTEMVLNPGDETVFRHSYTVTIDGGNTYTYFKGQGAIVFKIMGSLSHSEADEKLVHHSIASCDVESHRTVNVSVRDALFTGIRRIKDNASVTAFTDDVVAGDATQHPADG